MSKNPENLICEFIIPKYIRLYIKSKNVKEKFYEKGKKKLLQKYCSKHKYETQGLLEPDGVNYIWRQYPVIRQQRKVLIDFLVDVKSDLRVISNEKQVGKIKYGNINGQSIFNGNIKQHERNNMIGTIKDYVRPFIKQIKQINKYPIRIDCYLFDLIYDNSYGAGGLWDVENRFFPYGKAFHDLLSELKVEKGGNIPRRLYNKSENGNILEDSIIKDDNILYITEPAHPIFCPIENSDDAKLVFKIYHDVRNIIINDIDYKNKHI